MHSPKLHRTQEIIIILRFYEKSLALGFIFVSMCLMYPSNSRCIEDVDDLCQCVNELMPYRNEKVWPNKNERSSKRFTVQHRLAGSTPLIFNAMLDREFSRLFFCTRLIRFHPPPPADIGGKLNTSSGSVKFNIIFRSDKWFVGQVQQ